MPNARAATETPVGSLRDVNTIVPIPNAADASATRLAVTRTKIRLRRRTNSMSRRWYDAIAMRIAIGNSRRTAGCARSNQFGGVWPAGTMSWYATW